MKSLTPGDPSGHARLIVDLLRRSFIETGDPLVAHSIREVHVMQGRTRRRRSPGIVADLL